MRSLIVTTTVIVLLFAGTAYAQNAQITGTVKDNSGGVVPGVTVTANNEQTGLARAAVTNDLGEYRLQALPPGRYAVTTELAGFQTQTHSGIVLAIDQTAILNVTVAPAAIEESVTVTGIAPIVDVTQSDVSTGITTAQIESLPVAERRWVDLAMLTPGTSQDAIRGQVYRGNVNVGMGLRFYSNMFLVDGLNNNWAQQGEPRQDFGMDAIREFRVSTSNYKAEHGLATGGILSVVTKSGTNTLRGSGFLFYRDDSLTAIEKFQQEKPPFQRYQYGGSVGGPIVRDRTHFFAQYERTDQDVFFTVSTGGIWPEHEGSSLSKQYFQNDTTRVDHQLTGAQSLFGRWSADRSERQINQDGGPTWTPSASKDRGKPVHSLVVGHTWVMGSRAVNEVRFQKAYSKYVGAAPYSLPDGNFKPGDFSQTRLDLLRPIFQFPTLRLGASDTQMGEENRYQIKNDFSYTMPDWGGSHQWKMGIDFSYVHFAADNTTGTFGIWTFPRDELYDPNDTSTWPTQYTQDLPRFAEIPFEHLATYVQDDWKPLRNLTLNLGLRYDVQFGSFNEDTPGLLRRIERVLGPGFGFPIPIPFHEGVDRRGDRNNLGPRIGVAWDPTGAATTNVHAGYGIFYEHQRTLQAFGELQWPQAKRVVIRNPSFPDPFQGRSREEFLSNAPPNITVLSNDLVNPYAHHFNVGLAHQLARDLGVSVDLTMSWRRADLDTVDPNLPDEVSRQRAFPQFNRVSFRQSSSEGAYKALFLKVDKRLSNRYQFLVSYTLTKAEDHPMSNVLGDTYGYVRVKGPAAAERRHRLVASGIFLLPLDIQVSAIADFRSALPFNPRTSLDINGDGYTGDLPPGVGYFSGCRDLNVDAINAFRTARGLAAVSEIDCPSWGNMDLRVTKAFSLKGSHQIDFIVQLLNVFNRAQLNEALSNPGSAAFGQAAGIIPFITNAASRQIELGIRYAF